MALLVWILVVLSFTALLTAHVLIAAGLVVQSPWWRGAVAFVVPPLAPYWGFRERMRGRSIVWIVAIVVYVAARFAARMLVR